jgi:hypothetical protein
MTITPEDMDEVRARAKLVKMRCVKCAKEILVDPDSRLVLNEDGGTSIVCVNCITKARDGVS